MSLIYNALKEQEHPVYGDTYLEAAKGVVVSPFASRQRKSRFRFLTLMIICGLLSGLLIVGYSLWHVKRTNNFPTSAPYSVKKLATGGLIKNGAIPLVKMNPVATAPIKNSLNQEENIAKQANLGAFSVLPEITSRVVRPKRLLISVPPKFKKVITASSQTPTMAAIHKEVRVTAAVDKSTVPVNTERHGTMDRFQSTRVFLREIGELVSHLKVSMRGRNTARTESLLQNLEQKAGSGNIIFLQMRAYWLLQQQKNDMAQKAYQQLLAEQPDDMAANLNMAILELRVGNHRPALDRLKRMASLYPDSVQVRDFLHKVRSAGGR